MNIIIDRYNKIKSNIKKVVNENNVQIVAVSKTFSFNHIKPLIDHGHEHFGENKVQEAQVKWAECIRHNKNIKLHLIGRLQSNKVKIAVKIFDYIHSLDSKKLADACSSEERKNNKKIKYFIQVNIGKESQKSGIRPDEIDQFYTYCKQEAKLDIVGLMAIPPNNDLPDKYFKFLNDHNKSLNLPELSMGMSADYLKAVEHNSTFLRIGSDIFGNRT